MKNLKSKIIFSFLILIFLFYFLFNFGFKIIFSVSSLIGNLNNKIYPTPNIPKENFIGELSIDSIPQATNSANFLVQGKAVNFDSVYFYLNNEKIKKIDLEGETDFLEEIDKLKEGKNLLYAIAKNKDYSKKTPVYEILYKSKKPKLEISQPKDGEESLNQEIIIKGITDKETFIKINDAPVTVDALGNFELTITLKNEGENIIQITAEDIAGNIETKEIKVFYKK